MFNFDHKISYDEFVKTIFHHARNYEIKTSDPSQQRVIVRKLLERAKQEQSERHYGNAYYFVVKCLHFFDKDENKVDFVQGDSKVRDIMRVALDMEETLKQRPLTIEYNAILEEVERREPERRRIVADQLEVENPAVNDQQPFTAVANNHTARQQQILSNEADSMMRLRRKLTGRTSIGGQPNFAVPAPQPQSLYSPSPPPPNFYTSPTVAQDLYAPPPPLPDTFAAPTPPAALVPQPTSPTPSLPQPLYSGGLPPSPSPLSQSASISANGTRFISTPTSTYTRCLLNPQSAGVTVPRRGIINLGNTCYINSVLQVLNAIPLGLYFLSDQYVPQLVTREGKLTRLINSFSFVMRELNRKDCLSAVSTSPFKTALGQYYEGFENSRQQDANEFLRVVLDGVHSALNAKAESKLSFPEIDNAAGSDDDLARRFWAQYYQKNNSVVVDYCAFQERSMIVCPQCERQSRSFNVSLNVEVPIPHDGRRVSLDDCISLYCREEVLDNSSLYLCPGCQQKVNARKQLLFYSAPPVLFIALKRFRSYGDFSTSSKVNTDVFFNKTLDLSPYMCSSFSKTKYRLVGIVNHQGNMHGGHYTADAIGPDGVWCNFSDERVTRSEMADNGLAYVLCYVR